MERESVLVMFLIFFGLIACIFEPLFYTSHPAWWSGTPSFPPMVALWQKYYIFPFDPIFDEPPFWLQLFCWIEVLVFGPLYFISAALIWLKSPIRIQSLIILPFAGALFYSTICYFILEIVESIPGTDFLGVILINLPWTILPIALLWHQFERGRKTNLAKKD